MVKLSDVGTRPGPVILDRLLLFYWFEGNCYARDMLFIRLAFWAGGS